MVKKKKKDTLGSFFCSCVLCPHEHTPVCVEENALRGEQPANCFSRRPFPNPGTGRRRAGAGKPAQAAKPKVQHQCMLAARASGAVPPCFLCCSSIALGLGLLGTHAIAPPLLARTRASHSRHVTLKEAQPAEWLVQKRSNACCSHCDL